MADLRRQIAATQDNLTALSSGDKETFNDLDKFQPSEQFGRNMSVLMLEMSLRAGLFIFPVASAKFQIAIEAQLSTSATFGDKDNILASLMTQVSSLVGATTVGPIGPSQAHENITLNPIGVPLATVNIPGAIYLNAQIWNLASSEDLAIGICKIASQAIVYYRQQ